MARGRLDWLIIGLYAAIVITAASARDGSPRPARAISWAGRRSGWPLIGALLYAANISTEHFVGLAGGRLSHRPGDRLLRIIAVFCLIPLIVLFLPFYIKNQIYTVPEFPSGGSPPACVWPSLRLHDRPFLWCW